MQPRWYQEEATQAAWQWLRDRKDNPCIELPTGAGKSLVIAMLIDDVIGWQGRAILLAHRKELLEQTKEKIEQLSPGTDVGVYSAGLGSRDTKHQVIVAGIQSVYNRADKLGAFNVVIVDEAHLIPPSGDGMYQSFLSDARVINPSLKVIGLTATPYRLKEGLVCGPHHVLNGICYKVGVRELINQGFLCPLTSKSTESAIDTDGVAVRGGEFVASDLSQHIMGDAAKIELACQEIADKTRGRHSVLVFASGRDHAKAIQDRLSKLVDGQVGYVDGDTPSEQRSTILEAFRQQHLRFLVNIDVLTTGFDATCVDCVCLLRPTLSPGLYYQMVGRGLRLDRSKQNCLVLDFGGNVDRHGPIDKMEIKPRSQGQSGGEREPLTKVCGQCSEIDLIGARVCSSCGASYPEPEIKHDTKASDSPVISGPVQPPVEYSVKDVTYQVHVKRNAGADAPRTMRVTYETGFSEYVSEWVCVEHAGFARDKALKWWSARCDAPMPSDADEAVRLGRLKYLAEPERIVVDESGEFKRIVEYLNMSEIPEVGDIGCSPIVDAAQELLDAEQIDWDDVPF